MKALVSLTWTQDAAFAGEIEYLLFLGLINLFLSLPHQLIVGRR
jgi:hypothetical protein